MGGKGIKADVVVTLTPFVDRQTDTYENITFPHSVAGGNDGLHLKVCRVNKRK